MKWIVLSDNRPSQLHSLLESGRKFLPNTIPEVLVDIGAQQDLYLAYEIVASRFRARWHILQDFRTDLLRIISTPGRNLTLDNSLLLTTETMRFTNRLILHNPTVALKDKNILGFSLTRGAGEDGAPKGMHDCPNRRDASTYYSWMVNGQSGPWAERFTLGTIYRTNDLIGPLCRMPWNSIKTLHSALSEDQSLRLHPRLACLQEPCLIDQPLLADGMVTRYIGGEVLDVDKLSATGPLPWKLYEEET